MREDGCAKKIIVSVLLCLLMPFGLAATQGEVGKTSTGTLKVKASVKEQIIINKLDDVSFESFVAGSAPPSKNINFCVGTNRANSKLYDVKVTGNHDSEGDFRLTLNGAATAKSDEAMVYSVVLTDADGTSRTLTAGQVENNDDNGFATASNLSCTNENQKLSITITSDTSINHEGQYQDRLTMLVSPL